MALDNKVYREAENTFLERMARNLRTRMFNLAQLEGCDYLWVTVQRDRPGAFLILCRSSAHDYPLRAPIGYYSYGVPADIGRGAVPEVFIDYKFHPDQAVELAELVLGIVENWWPNKFVYGVRVSELVYNKA